MKMFIVLLSSCLAWPVHAKLKVVTTTTTLQTLAEEVGQNKIVVSSLTKPTQDPHFVEAKPSYMVKIRRADLLVAVGLDLEVGWLSNVQRGAKNPKLLNKSQGYFEAGDHIAAIEVPAGKIDRAHGDVHPQGNPHFHLDPTKAVAVALALAEKFSQLDVKNKDFYQKNAIEFQSKINTQISLWRNRLRASKIDKVVTYHKSYNYFLKFFNIKPVATIEPKPGIPPTAKHIIGLIKLIKDQKVKCIINERYFETIAAKRLQKETGASVQVTSVEALESYPQLIEELVVAFENCGKGA